MIRKTGTTLIAALCVVAATATLLVFALAATASADPMFTPFLQVDLNGENGPSQTPGFEPWNFVRDPVTNTFLNSFAGLPASAVPSGTLSATLVASNNAGVNPGSRNRGGPDGGNDVYLSNVHRDLLFIAHDGSVGWGRDYMKLELSGLVANTMYEITAWSFDTGHDNADLGKHAAWTSIEALGGLDGPRAWLETNLGAGTSYQPTDMAPAGYKNPIPTLARPLMAGAWPSDLSILDPYHYSASFKVTSDANGAATIYGWADSDTFSGTQHMPFNGFAIGIVPEPASLALLCIGLTGIVAHRRRKR